MSVGEVAQVFRVIHVAHTQPGLQLTILIVVRPQINPGVAPAADVETGIAVVIAELQGTAVFGHLTPGFAGVGILQPHPGEQAVGQRTTLAGKNQRQIVSQLRRPLHAAHNGIQILTQRRAADIDAIFVAAQRQRQRHAVGFLRIG